MKKFLLSISKKSVLLRKIMRKILFVVQRCKYMLFFIFNETNPKLVVFESFSGRNYSDSPKALYLEMLNNKKYKDYSFVWCFIHPEKYNDLINDRTQVIKYNSKKYIEIYSKAKYWFTCSRLPSYIKPRKNQVYVQCWHGTPLKRLGFDIKVKGENALNTVPEWQKIYEDDAKRYTHMISPSNFCTEKLISAFNLKNIEKKDIMIEKGYPRNDYLYSYNENDVKRIKEELKISEDKKVILYAPTWRDNQHDAKIGYTYSLSLDFKKLMDLYKNEYVILFRTHYLVASKINLEEYKGFVYNVSEYNDVNELYIISDILITDYSSVFFDYANLKRPMLFYMYDLQEYKNKMRDFYISFDELPGPIVETESELIKELNNIEDYNNRYKVKYNNFNAKYTYLDSKSSSIKVLDEIIK